MEDTINTIIKELDARGLTYIRFYNSDRVRGRHGQGWIVKCVRQRRDGTTAIIEASSQGDPADAIEALVIAVNKEMEEYLDRTSQEV